MTTTRRTASGFATGFAIGNLGGMIGLGGAEFRLPLLVGHFRLDALSAIILNKACSLVVVAAALLIRSTSISPSELWAQRGIVFNLLAGSLLGAWWAAGHAMTIPKQRLNAFILVLLLGLGLFMLAEAVIGQGSVTQLLITDPTVQFLAGIGAGVWKDADELRSLLRDYSIFNPEMSEEKRSRELKLWQKGVERSKHWVD